ALSDSWQERSWTPFHEGKSMNRYRFLIVTPTLLELDTPDPWLSGDQVSEPQTANSRCRLDEVLLVGQIPPEQTDFHIMLGNQPGQLGPHQPVGILSNHVRQWGAPGEICFALPVVTHGQADITDGHRNQIAGIDARRPFRDRKFLGGAVNSQT